MIKEIQVTLYDIFGYLLPGTVVTAALATAFVAIYFPQEAVTFDLRTTETWLTFLILSYVAGHMGQALGNIVVKCWKWDEGKVVGKLPADLREAVTDKFKERLGDKAGGVSARWVYELCDDAILRSGKLGEREVYLYREGFYRGLFVGFGLLAIGIAGLIARLLFEPGLNFTLGSWRATPVQLVFFLILSAAWAYLSLRRYWRFMEYRVKHSVLGFLSITAAREGDEPKKAEGKTDVA